MPLAAVEEKTAINLQHGHTVAMFCQISPKNLKLVFGLKFARTWTYDFDSTVKVSFSNSPKTENTSV